LIVVLVFFEYSLCYRSDRTGTSILREGVAPNSTFRVELENRVRLPRFYPILDVGSARNRRLEISGVAREILEAGATILQFRHKGFFGRDVFAELERIAALCRQADALLVVNDRVDIARMLLARGSDSGKLRTGAERVGVHLGQQDLTPEEARRTLAAATIIGLSTHSELELREAESSLASLPADYLAFGPIFGTASKENPDPVVGLDELRRLRPLTSRPLVAIGGITRANARRVIDAGADSVAVIGDLFPADLSAGSGRIRARAAEWLAVLGS
jgi:thiamine-phosphate pyrophosphorylase